MNKILTMLAVAGAVTGTAAAQQYAATVDVVPAMNGRNVEMSQGPRIVESRLSTPQTGLITTPPKGEMRQYYREGWFMYPTLENLYISYDSGWMSDIVFCENGDVYMSNTNSGRINNTWIKGRKEGNDLIFQFPQVIEEDEIPGDALDNYLVTMLASVLDPTTGLLADYIPIDDPEQNRLVLHMNEDGTEIWQDTEEWDKDNEWPPTIMGIVAYEQDYKDYLWLYYGDSDLTYKEVTENDYLRLPEGKTPETWVMKYGMDNNRFLNVCIDGNEVWIGNWEAGYEDSWVKGTINEDGDEIVIPSGYILGRHDMSNHYLALMAGYENFNPVTHKSTYETLPNIVLSYDAEEGEMACDHMILVNCGAGAFDAWEQYDNVIINWRDPATEIKAPATPDMAFESKYYEEIGCGNWFFHIYNYDVDGNPLDQGRIYFNIYLDGDDYILKAPDYAGIETPMFDIPYDYINPDCNIFYNGHLHQVPYFMMNYDYIEVQSFYLKEDGTKVYSAKYRHVPEKEEPGAVEGVAADVASTTYYDLQGRRINNPAKGGVYVKKNIMTDGTSKTSKVVIK